MIIRRSVLAAIVCWGGFAFADHAGDRQAGIEKWIAQLSSDDWKLRQEAMEQLVGLGEDALGRLRKLVNTTEDGEVRSRASSAIGQIEENRIIGASLITLNLHDVPPAQALAEISRQARAAIQTDPVNLLSQKNLKQVSLMADHEPFWKVLQSFSEQCDLEVTGITRRNREIGLGLTHGTGEWMDKPIVLSGPLLIRADRITRVSTIRLRPPRDETQEFNISLSAFAEPKLKVMDYSGAIKLLEVVDEKGHSLIPPQEDEAPVANTDVFGNNNERHTTHWEMGATLHYPKGSGTRIVRLRATTALQVRIRSAELDLSMAGARNVTKSVGGFRVLVKALDLAHCELSIYRDGRSDADWYASRLQLNASEARLTDEKGRVFARSQGSADIDESPDSQRIDLKIRFAREGSDESNKESKKDGLPEATRLVWEFPMEIRELRVPFEFRDLPIP
jgi:hypothetical protein